MKYWPEKRWKKMLFIILLVCIIVFVTVVPILALIGTGKISREVISPISVINEGGSKTALVIYQPGLLGFPHDATYAFADGLASAGWRVEVTTASPQAPTNLSKYSLLTLAYPVYGSSVGSAIKTYVDRVPDFNGTKVTIISTAGGTTHTSIDALRQQVEQQNGTVQDGIALSMFDGSAVEKARQAGNGITP